MKPVILTIFSFPSLVSLEVLKGRLTLLPNKAFKLEEFFGAWWSGILCHCPLVLSVPHFFGVATSGSLFMGSLELVILAL